MIDCIYVCKWREEHVHLYQFWVYMWIYMYKCIVCIVCGADICQLSNEQFPLQWFLIIDAKLPLTTTTTIKNKKIYPMVT